MCMCVCVCVLAYSRPLLRSWPIVMVVSVHCMWGHGCMCHGALTKRRGLTLHQWYWLHIRGLGACSGEVSRLTGHPSSFSFNGCTFSGNQAVSVGVRCEPVYIHTHTTYIYIYGFVYKYVYIYIYIYIYMDSFDKVQFCLFIHLIRLSMLVFHLLLFSSVWNED